MTLPVFIGDEVTATGYRLAGIEIRVPVTPDATEQELARARGSASLILISAEYAGHVQAGKLREAVSRAAPPVLIVPDAAGRVAVPALAASARATVGLE